jgi:hypothetical protein
MTTKHPTGMHAQLQVVRKFLLVVLQLFVELFLFVGDALLRGRQQRRHLRRLPDSHPALVQDDVLHLELEVLEEVHLPPRDNNFL